MLPNDEAQRIAEEPYEDAPLPQGEEPWAVRTLADADWSLERLGELEQQIRENNKLAELAVLRIETRKALLNEKAMRGVRFFRGHLHSFALTSRETVLGTGKRKTRELLHGSIAYRKTGGSLEVLDKELLLKWATKQPIELGYVRIKEEPAIDEIKRAFKASGEIPMGCDIKPETETIDIKVIERETPREH